MRFNLTLWNYWCALMRSYFTIHSKRALLLADIVEKKSTLSETKVGVQKYRRVLREMKEAHIKAQKQLSQYKEQIQGELSNPDTWHYLHTQQYHY